MIVIIKLFHVVVLAVRKLNVKAYWSIAVSQMYNVM